MTIDELERWLAHAITGVYHRRVHRASSAATGGLGARDCWGSTRLPGAASPTTVPIHVGY